MILIYWIATFFLFLYRFGFITAKSNNNVTTATTATSDAIPQNLTFSNSGIDNLWVSFDGPNVLPVSKDELRQHLLQHQQWEQHHLHRQGEPHKRDRRNLSALESIGNKGKLKKIPTSDDNSVASNVTEASTFETTPSDAVIAAPVTIFGLPNSSESALQSGNGAFVKKVYSGLHWKNDAHHKWIRSDKSYDFTYVWPYNFFDIHNDEPNIDSKNETAQSRDTLHYPRNESLLRQLRPKRSTPFNVSNELFHFWMRNRTQQKSIGDKGREASLQTYPEWQWKQNNNAERENLESRRVWEQECRRNWYKLYLAKKHRRRKELIEHRLRMDQKNGYWNGRPIGCGDKWHRDHWDKWSGGQWKFHKFHNRIDSEIPVAKRAERMVELEGAEIHGKSENHNHTSAEADHNHDSNHLDQFHEGGKNHLRKKGMKLEKSEVIRREGGNHIHTSEEKDHNHNVKPLKDYHDGGENHLKNKNEMESPNLDPSSSLADKRRWTNVASYDAEMTTATATFTSTTPAISISDFLPLTPLRVGRRRRQENGTASVTPAEWRNASGPNVLDKASITVEPMLARLQNLIVRNLICDNYKILNTWKWLRCKIQANVGGEMQLWNSVQKTE